MGLPETVTILPVTGVVCACSVNDTKKSPEKISRIIFLIKWSLVKEVILIYGRNEPMYDKKHDKKGRVV